MDSAESVYWLKKNGLYRQCAKYSRLLRVIFTVCLKAKDDVLIVGDVGSKGYEVAPVYCGACFLAARSLDLNAKLVMQSPRTNAEQVTAEIKSSLEHLRPRGVVILGLSSRLGRLFDDKRNFRRFCKERNLRWSSTPSLGALKTSMASRLFDAIDIDYKSQSWLHKEVKYLLDNGEVMHLTTKAGTDLRVGIKGCTAVASDGYYHSAGSGGNIPAGEVFIAPAKKQVNGRVVVDASSRNRESTVLVRKPIILDIEEGVVVRIEGGREADLLRSTIRWAEEHASHDWGIRRIGEIGIGLNPRARISGAMIIDEKVKGTAHVAIGSNNWFGGGVWAMIHLDQVFKNPKITVDGRYVRV